MKVIIGMDPHKRSATIEIIDPTGTALATGRYGTDNAGYSEMLIAARKYKDRVWAIEGCNGIGRHIAHRLVHDSETVIDVSAKLSAQIRVFTTGNGRKTDPVDAHSVALAALRSPNLRQVHADSELIAWACSLIAAANSAAPAPTPSTGCTGCCWKPDDQQLKSTFEGALARATAGEGVRTDSGLDFETFTALANVSAAWPTVPPTLIEAARATFARQLDGSNGAVDVPSFLRGRRDS
ncbi:transposase [Nocardia sp. NPDC051321]|uniref:IS110 family transposase n=1 Tax=Nocardia sp. NPDC051321 TaxID=3364323 RepID=UPI0037AFF1EF